VTLLTNGSHSSSWAGNGEKNRADDRRRIAGALKSHEQRQEERHQLHGAHRQQGRSVSRSPHCPGSEAGRDQWCGDHLAKPLDGQLGDPANRQVDLDRHPVEAAANRVSIDEGDPIAGTQIGLRGRSAGDGIDDPHASAVERESQSEGNRTPQITVDEQHPVSEEGRRDEEDDGCCAPVLHRWARTCRMIIRAHTAATTASTVRAARKDDSRAHSWMPRSTGHSTLARAGFTSELGFLFRDFVFSWLIA
jgi:hypothetical protein